MAKIDIVLVNPGNKRQIFQDLGKDLAAIEPPFWIAVIAAYLRNNGFEVRIVDANAEGISFQETAEKVNQLSPLLACLIVYGSQPSASTQNMANSVSICKELKRNPQMKVAIGGLHPSALPGLTLEESKADFVVEGEGPFTIKSLLHQLKLKSDDFSSVPGLWYYKGNIKNNNPRANLIEDLDEMLPVAAWDLLPMHKYRAHNWHCFNPNYSRAPYAAVYTSLGCPYHCIFCCINAPFGKPGIRYRSPALVVQEIELLAHQYGIKNIKIVDELFILEEKHYMAIVDLLIKKGIELNIWAYSRVDTIKLKNLQKMKKSGINWLALGIESADQDVRDGAFKKIAVKDIKSIIRAVQNAGINVIGNFIFGLPEDNAETMQKTLDLALDLNCEFANFYCAMAYPGSQLYDLALKKGWEMPKQWNGFSQHSYETLPLPTKYLSAREVLGFRDEAFRKYFENHLYLNMIENKFGKNVRENIQEMAKTKLKRKILEN